MLYFITVWKIARWLHIQIQSLNKPVPVPYPLNIYQRHLFQIPEAKQQQKLDPNPKHRWKNKHIYLAEFSQNRLFTPTRQTVSSDILHTSKMKYPTERSQSEDCCTTNSIPKRLYCEISWNVVRSSGIARARWSQLPRLHVTGMHCIPRGATDFLGLFCSDIASFRCSDLYWFHSVYSFD